MITSVYFRSGLCGRIEWCSGLEGGPAVEAGGEEVVEAGHPGTRVRAPVPGAAGGGRPG